MLSGTLQMILRPFWRMTRGLTLGAQGIVVDGNGRVLMVRHSYRPGWHFPGGGVEWRESIHTAISRELAEETGVIISGTAELHGMFTNFEKFPCDHIAVFLVRTWERPKLPAANLEIRETSFFAIDALPEDASPGVRRRVAEVFHGAEKSEIW